jgi:beta-glucosidase
MALHDGQNEMLEQIAGLNPKTVVILVGGSSVEMPWVDAVPAIVQMWYAGMEGGNAIARILLGAVNPSGKLPITFPKALRDFPAALDDYGPDTCRYREGIFVGYRWFDANAIAPLFPFGHGLSYTTFALGDLRVEKSAGGFRVSVDVTNSGKIAGAEVVQIYVGQLKPSIKRPVRELKGFVKVKLGPGEMRRVDVLLEKVAFAFWDSGSNDWMVEPGEFVIEAGVSSRDLRERSIFSID